ncbi:precorrin-4 C11-methyltransferase [Micromonospora sp. BL4]|uniref:precorrin-4 C11-methyltransferase n=1 Tax=Micromonospora sp. BL4 TaxID=2478710 RepID=UPI001F276E56|nr:precorrin-4 C11-methyltransferase [Micromonospora sp. BL4]
MSKGADIPEGPSPSSIAPVVCPVWCRGCGPNDPMHRGLLTTIGRERSGWVTVQLVVDRFARRDLAVKLDATRYGATQTVLLSSAQVDRLIDELVYAHLEMLTPVDSDERAGEAR